MKKWTREFIRFGSLELRVGLFILIPIAILVVVILLKLGYSLATSTMDVYLKIDNMTSVQEGTPVHIKGYPVGRVVEVEPVHEPALHFLATLRIRKDITIDENCSALIMSQGVIGDPVIEIRNPEYRGDQLLAGDVIEGIEMGSIEEIVKKVNVLLSEVTATVSVYREVSQESKHNIRSLVTSLAGSVANINRILNDSQKDIIQIFMNLRKTSQTLDEVSRELKKHPMKFLFRGKDEKNE